MLPFLYWLLIVDGLTMIVTRSSLFLPLRLALDEHAPARLAELVRCPMCFGFWAGAFSSIAGLTPFVYPGLPWWVSAWAVGCASSAACFTMTGVRQKLGIIELTAKGLGSPTPASSAASLFGGKP